MAQAVSDHGSGKTGVVRGFPLHIVLGHEFLPPRQDCPFILQENEQWRTESSQLRFCVAAGHAQSVHSNRARRDNPKLVKVLRHNRRNMTAGSQPTKALDGFRMLRIYGVDPTRENIRVEKTVHSPRSP
ncbi:MAG: hypothetical protein O3C40_08350 [Planctomycetota bacterium]|nr:hypothetical protein [Planctomycetota bacterium]